MEPGTLEEILAVEKQLRAELDAEQGKASRWLEAERREIETAHRAELEAIRQSGLAAESRARQAARETAVARDAVAATFSVDRWPDEELRGRVRERISAIVPESIRAR